jgi:predicted nucleotidyltransferase
MAKKESAIKEAVEQSFIQLLKDNFGENLLSVILYGSYVSGDFVPGVSDVNVLVIIDRGNSEQFRNLGKRAHKLMRKYKITPLILTRTDFNSSADVFPMEYADIRDRNRVLFGEDETKSLALEKKNLRHQLEERLRGSVASLRQLIIASKGRRKVLTNNLKFLFGSLKALFRGLLRLKEIKNIPTEGEKIVETLGSEFGVKIESLKNLLRLRGGGKLDVEALAGDVLDSLQELIGKIDKMEFKK